MNNNDKAPRIKPRPWTAEEEASLIQMKATGKTQREIAAALGRSCTSIRAKASRITEARLKPLSGEELSVIRRAYEQSGDGMVMIDSLAERLGRSKHLICRHARRMGLTNARRIDTSITERNPNTGDRDTRKFKGDEAALRRRFSESTKEWQAQNGHPRGMAGKKHAPATKAKISKTSKERWESMTEEQRDAQIEKSAKASAFSKKKRTHGRGTTWKAGWREFNGKRHYVRSRWEANVAHYLDFLVANGEMYKWEYEPDTFWFEKIKRGVRSYKPDFKVWDREGDEPYYIEVKGWMCPRSKTTLKRMKKYHPDVRVDLIQADRYKEIEKTAGPLIAEWES